MLRVLTWKSEPTCQAPWYSFYDLKHNPVNFDPSLYGFQHYAVFAYRRTECGNNRTGLASGFRDDDFMVTLLQNQSNLRQAGTFMHELGHNLNQRHSGLGSSNISRFKPNHQSVMSYRWRESIVATISGGTSQIQRNGIAGTMGLRCD